MDTPADIERRRIAIFEGHFVRLKWTVERLVIEPMVRRLIQYNNKKEFAMNWEEAKKAMEEGKLVRLPAWHESHRLATDKGKINLLQETCVTFNWRPNESELSAEDWEVIEDV